MGQALFPKCSANSDSVTCHRSFVGRLIRNPTGARGDNQVKVSLHQARLWADPPSSNAVEPDAVEAYRAGEIDLADALAVAPATIRGLRLQAIAFLEAGKWSAARDVALALFALGRIHPIDAFVLAAALAHLGDERSERAARAHRDRLLAALGVRTARTPDPESLRALLDRTSEQSVARVEVEWDHARRIGSALASFSAFTDHLTGELPIVDRVEAALRAIGPGASARAFPKQALGALRAIGRPAMRGSPRATRTAAPLAILGASLGGEVEDRLRRALAASNAPLRFERGLAACARLVEQATCAPSYCLTRMGWHYPVDRADYRARRYRRIVAELSEPRWQHSLEAAQAALVEVSAAPDPEGALEAFIQARFFIECGHDVCRAPIAPASVDAVGRALEHELLIPLRALNETILDFDLDAIGSRERARGMVDRLMRAISGATFDCYELFWGSKQDDRARGFDAAGHELLRDLARTGLFENLDAPVFEE
jgi:hypothetical protein